MGLRAALAGESGHALPGVAAYGVFFLLDLAALEHEQTCQPSRIRFCGDSPIGVTSQGEH
jgi:hypothetical protein